MTCPLEAAKRTIINIFRAPAPPENLPDMVILYKIHAPIRKSDEGRVASVIRAIFYLFDLRSDKFRFPLITVLAPLVWISIFIAGIVRYDASWTDDDTFSVDQLAEMNAIEYPTIIKHLTVYEFLTHGYAHKDLNHLIWNIAAFLFFAFYIEQKYGWWRTAITFNTGVIVSGLAYVLYLKMRQLDDRLYYLVGASAGSYALMGLYISESIVNHETIRNKYMHAAISLIVLGAHGFEYMNPWGQVAVFAHLGGLVVGLGPAVLCIPIYEREVWKVWFQVGSVAIAICCLVGIPIWIWVF